MLKSINPATGDVVGEYSQMTDDAVESCLSQAHDRFQSWRETSFAERAERMRAAADVLRDEADELASLMTREMGKPIKQARSEAEKCAWVCEYYAEHAATFLEPESVETDGSRSMIRYDPLGAIFAIMPWNFPLWQVFRFAAPNLMAGNVGLLKHASNVSGCSLAIEKVFANAGFPDHTFQSLLIDHDQSEEVMRDRRVRGITLTGSGRAGHTVGRIAGDALKPSVLELGGSDPFIVLDDCDLELAVDGAVIGRTQNNGQSCIAAKRFIVENGIIGEFTDRFVERMEALQIGDPTDEETDIGPMARPDLRDDLHDQVQRSVKEGAKLLTGGEVPDGPGNFYPPTVLGEVRPGMVAFDEETFGPVAAIIEADSLDHAILLANSSDYGLGASVWTERDSGLDDIARRIESGHVAFNGIVKSDPRLPFGGVKDSGYGRELSRHGILEFVNRKTVWIR